AEQLDVINARARGVRDLRGAVDDARAVHIQLSHTRRVGLHGDGHHHRVPTATSRAVRIVRTVPIVVLLFVVGISARLAAGKRRVRAGDVECELTVTERVRPVDGTDSNDPPRLWRTVAAKFQRLVPTVVSLYPMVPSRDLLVPHERAQVIRAARD